jgi:hypothetical protein
MANEMMQSNNKLSSRTQYKLSSRTQCGDLLAMRLLLSFHSIASDKTRLQETKQKNPSHTIFLKIKVRIKLS